MPQASSRRVALGQARRRCVSNQGCAAASVCAKKQRSARWLQQLAWACAAMLILLSLRVAGGVDALGRREACCRRMCSSVDLVLLLCATQKDRSQFCAMHESMVVSTSGLFAGALGFWKLLDRTYQAASHMAVRVGRARRSHARHSYSTVRAPSPH